MTRGRPKAAELVVTDDERAQLASFVRSRSLPAALVTRARIVLGSAEGEANSSIAERLKLTNATVGKWRRRFIERRIAGLYDDIRPGPPRSIDDERVANLINTTLHTKPADGSTHWSVRTVAAQTGISKSSVQRYFQLFGLQPHRTEGFKLSTDPFFIEKLRDVVGLYLSPPDKALVICVDEKSQCQALERTRPMLPMGFGYAEGVTHDYKRHGTTTLFAALNVLNGAVLASCKPRHRHQEFLSFLREIDTAVPAELDIHCIVDNYATHNHPKIKAWLASRPRWHLHFIPTYSSWLNQVERFFALITDKAIRRGSFTSVKQLVERIDQFVTHHNASSQPFQWTATAESILEKLHRLCSRISGTAHWRGVALSPRNDTPELSPCAASLSSISRRGVSLARRSPIHVRVTSLPESRQSRPAALGRQFQFAAIECSHWAASREGKRWPSARRPANVKCQSRAVRRAGKSHRPLWLRAVIRYKALTGSTQSIVLKNSPLIAKFQARATLSGTGHDGTTDGRTGQAVLLL